jgi:glycosyltransferase involved in cell wall biosynthesis
LSTGAGAPLRLLALSKRQYMGRDLLDDRYGRFRELPLAMARQGVQVRGLCVSYRPRPEVEVVDRAGGAEVAWRSFAPRRLWPRGAYWREVERLREDFAPQLVWAGSDIAQLALGRRVARRLGAKLVCDLYDNFESYPQARLPGMVPMLRRTVRGADAVACISSPLLRLVRTDYGYRGPAAVVENAVPAGEFVPVPRAEARARLGLPEDAELVGTAGALSPTRGIDALIGAFLRLAESRPRLHLVLAGPLDAGQALPAHPRLHYLGLLPGARVPALLSSLDVAVVCNVDSAFGRYCFPQKLYEALACGVPVVVADVGAMSELLAPWPGNRFAPGDGDALARALEAQLAAPFLPPLPVPDWDDLAQRTLGLCAEALAAPR